MDEKDRKLLSELDKDARTPDSVIAKRIGVSKQVVSYRISKLEEQGIIERFYSMVDVGQFGLTSYYLFVQLQHLTNEQELALYKRLCARIDVGWLVTGTGRWDMVLLLYARTITAFEQQLSEVLLLCGEHMHEYSFTILTGAEHLRYKFLRTTASVTHQQSSMNEQQTISADTLTILDAIAQDARAPVTRLAEKTGLPPHVVRYRLAENRKDGLITGFKPKLNIHKLGLQWYLLLLELKPMTENHRARFLAACRDHPTVYYLTRTIGNYHLMLDLHVRSVEEFRDALSFLKEKFADIIKTYESFTIFTEHKIDYVPRALIERTSQPKHPRRDR